MITKKRIKKLLKSRTFWSAKLKGVAGIIATVILMLDGDISMADAIPAIATTIWATIDVIIRIDTTKKIK